MRIVPDDDGHVRTALGLYYLGELDETDRATIEEHLAGCPDCLREYDDVGGAMPYVASLEQADIDSLDQAVARPPGRSVESDAKDQ
jgi:anti-sigma factor RsiW